MKQVNESNAKNKTKNNVFTLKLVWFALASAPS